MAADHDRVRQSLIRLANATCHLQLEPAHLNGEEIEKHALEQERAYEQKQTDMLKASAGTLTAAEAAGLMRRWFLFAKEAAEQIAQKAGTVKQDNLTIKETVYAKKTLSQVHWQIGAADLAGWQIDEIISRTSARVKNPSHFIEGKSLLFVELWETVEVIPGLTYDERIQIALDKGAGMRQLTLTWPLDRVYSRFTDVSAKIKLDLFGDGRLCLPLNSGREKEDYDWIIETKRVERGPIDGNPYYYGYKK